MATRFKANDLQEMIRSLVRKEMKENLATMLNEVFTERYLSKIVETVSNAKPRGVNNLTIQGDGPEDEDENVPHTLANTILGVGQENPVYRKEPKDDGVEQYEESTKRTDMLSLFFEGTTPMTGEYDTDAGAAFAPDEEEQKVLDEARAFTPPPPQQRIKQAPKPGRRSQEEVWKELAGVKAISKQESHAVSVADQEKFEELRLKRMRESLEVKPA